ncbi:uncharacterized protein LOC119586361 [Penaeus monodon]|uniref:uncharacterized protein LOC119586361 n=1 Tax=Penaeus monodon TaxID=6687 RepID=UPI0018A75311|nr:uncharacterized protein LOC119586361 [Penaeus monodon]
MSPRYLLWIVCWRCGEPMEATLRGRVRGSGGKPRQGLHTLLLWRKAQASAGRTERRPPEGGRRGGRPPGTRRGTRGSVGPARLEDRLRERALRVTRRGLLSAWFTGQKESDLIMVL